MKTWAVPLPEKNVLPRDWPQLLVLAATLVGEAEGTDAQGKLAVAQVIMNRVASPKFPNDVTSVCLQHQQFSCWNDGSARYRTMLDPQLYTSEVAWTQCFIAAVQAMFHLVPDVTGSADHYLNPVVTRRIRGDGTLPSWYDENKVTARIGDHVFLCL